MAALVRVWLPPFGSAPSPPSPLTFSSPPASGTSMGLEPGCQGQTKVSRSAPLSSSAWSHRAGQAALSFLFCFGSYFFFFFFLSTLSSDQKIAESLPTPTPPPLQRPPPPAENSLSSGTRMVGVANEGTLATWGPADPSGGAPGPDQPSSLWGLVPVPLLPSPPLRQHLSHTTKVCIGSCTHTPGAAPGEAGGSWQSFREGARSPHSTFARRSIVPT